MVNVPKGQSFDEYYAQAISKAAPWAIYGAFLILFMYVMPRGVAGFVRIVWGRLFTARK